MSFAVGSLVKARGREWVVLPESEGDLLMLRPLGGTDEEEAGILSTLESVEPAQFDLPDPNQLGDHLSCRLLRDAVRLGFRSSAGPFRSFAKIAVEPRPYQLVPLLMALKLDPVRLLIADDVGIGKTIEACLVARELLDRGEIHRLACSARRTWPSSGSVSCATSSTSTPNWCCPAPSPGSNVTAVGAVPLRCLSRSPSSPWTSSRPTAAAHDFLRTCPELVIVDEAHTCAFGFEGRGGRHQRHELLKELAEERSAAFRPGHRDAAQRQRGGLPLAAVAPESRVRQPAR